jgi:hypothetical protein
MDKTSSAANLTNFKVRSQVVNAPEPELGYALSGRIRLTSGKTLLV